MGFHDDCRCCRLRCRISCCSCFYYSGAGSRCVIADVAVASVVIKGITIAQYMHQKEKNAHPRTNMKKAVVVAATTTLSVELIIRVVLVIRRHRRCRHCHDFSPKDRDYGRRLSLFVDGCGKLCVCVCV